MVSHLTNNETYFYREGPSSRCSPSTVLRQIKERKARAGTRTLRLLSAGCSTGEEAHTLAMIVFDSGQFFWNWDVRGRRAWTWTPRRSRRRSGASTSTTRSAPGARR